MRFKATEYTAMSVAGLALVGTIATAAFTWTNRNRELDIELVKIGVAILRAEPREEQTSGAREWAIEVIQTYSGQRFSEQAREQLLKGRLDVKGTTFGGYDPWGDTIFGDAPPRRRVPATPEKN